MIRLAIFAAAASVCVASPLAVSAESAGLFARPAEPSQRAAPPRPRGEAPEAPRREASPERPWPGVRPKPEPPPRPRPPAHYWPYHFYGERRDASPEREVVIIERPAPQPEAPAEPPAPAPRIDTCRTDPAPAVAEGGSGRVLFMAPPEDGCPRFSRAPSGDAPQSASADPPR